MRSAMEQGSGQHVLINGSFAPSLINFRGKLIECLISRGHHVFASAPNMTSEVAMQIEALGATPVDVALDRTGSGPISDLRYCLALYRVMRRVRPDVVLNYTIKPNIWGSFAARLAGVRSFSMVTGLGFAFIPGAGMARAVMQGIARTLYRYAAALNERLIFQNPDDMADFATAGCLRHPDRVEFVNGSGVDLDHFRPAPLPGDAHFLMIARLLVTKGVREYAEASLACINKGISARFSLAGFLDEGPDAISEDELQRWVAGGLYFIGQLSDVRGALSDCSVYVLPSYREGTPRTVLEAMAMGRPVIVTDAPGCRETVEHGRNGLTVPVRNTVALAAAMEELARSPDRRALMASESLQLVRTKYDVNEVNGRMAEILGL